MKLATTTAIILMLGATPLLASSERGAMAPMMPALDFEAADADGNGAITQDEWTAYLGDVMETRSAAMFDRRAEQMIEAGDSDGDGLLSREELVAAFEARHEANRGQMADRAEARAETRAEGQGDGTRSERRAERRAEGRAGRGAENRADRPRRGQGPHAHRGGMMTPEAFATRSFSRMDANSDGEISAEEFATAQERWAERSSRHGGRSGADNSDAGQTD